MLTAHDDSHHDLTPAHVAFLRSHFAGKVGFFVETVTLPDDLPDLACGLYGPIVGDAPVAETEVVYARRGESAYSTRTAARPTRPTRLLTAIGRAYEDAPCVLYAAYGGPMVPEAPMFPTEKAHEKYVAFWAVHALAA